MFLESNWVNIELLQIQLSLPRGKLAIRWVNWSFSSPSSLLTKPASCTDAHTRFNPWSLSVNNSPRWKHITTLYRPLSWVEAVLSSHVGHVISISLTQMAHMTWMYGLVAFICTWPIKSMKAWFCSTEQKQNETDHQHHPRSIWRCEERMTGKLSTWRPTLLWRSLRRKDVQRRFALYLLLAGDFADLVRETYWVCIDVAQRWRAG